MDSSHHTQRHGPPAAHDRSEARVEFRFVGQDGNEERTSGRAGLAKAHHKKSRNGCLRCRARRVKCDEVHPVCGNCARHKADCVFEQVIATSSQKPPALQSDTLVEDPLKSASNTFESSVNREYAEHNESSARRLLELKLMHTYNTSTCHTICFDGDSASENTCIFKAPSLALNNNALLYSLLSFTAYHLVQMESPNASEMTFIHHRYWAMALEEHKNDLTKLSEHNYDAVCVTSMFVRLNAFVMLRDRPLVPYVPPTDWFQTTRGAMQVFKASYSFLEGNEHSATSQLVRRMPFCFDNDAKFAVSNRQSFLHLLAPIEGDTLEHMSPEDQEALESTLSYVGGVWSLTVGDAGTPSEICRRLIIMPYLVHTRFADLVAAQHPRALVILAHYFALLFRFRERWWIGATGGREVRALATVLSGDWRALIKWPLEVVDETIYESSNNVDL